MQTTPQEGGRIALMAVRGGEKAGSRCHVLVIGTFGDDTRWRYVIFDLGDLKQLLADARHPLDAPANLQAYGPRFYIDPDMETGLLRPNEREDVLDDAGTHIRRFLNAADPADAGERARIDFALPFRSVARLIFYRRDDQPGRSRVVPLAALDTCHDEPNPSSPEPTPPSPVPERSAFVHLGSRVILFRNRANPEDDPGLLDGFAVMGQVRLALNGHNSDLSSHTETADEANDTLGFLRLLAVRPKLASDKTPRSLWNMDGHWAAGGAQFDRLRIGFSVGHGGNDAGPNRVFSSLIKDADLSGFLPSDEASYGRERRAYKQAVRSGNDPAALANYIPAGAALGLPRDRRHHVTRELGFRAAEMKEKRVVRLILRLETTFAAIGQALQSGILEPTVPPGFAFPADDPGYILAQEQPRGTVNDSLEPSTRSAWVLTARADRLGTTPNDRVTPKILEASRAAVAGVHRSLREVRDAGPLSFLPLLTGDGPALPWHHVGFLIDVAPARRAFSARGDVVATFRTLEPRFIPDMWLGHGVSGSLEARGTGQLSRVALLGRDRAALSVAISAPLRANPRADKPALCTDAPSWQPAISELDPSEAPTGTTFSVRVIALTVSGSRTPLCQIGALRLRFAPDFRQRSGLNPHGAADIVGEVGTPADQTGLFRLLRLAADARDPTARRAGIDAVLKLPLAGLEPGAQDDLPDDARIKADQRAGDPLALSGHPDPDAPLLFPVGPAAPSDTARYHLVADETVTRHANHTLGLAVRAFKEGAGNESKEPDGRVVILDPRPLRVAAVAYGRFAALQTDGSNEIAVWNAGGENGLSWRLANEREAVHLLLPPQVLGEAMEKNIGPPAPADPHGGLTVQGLPPDVNEQVPAAARFGSATVLTLDPSYFDTRYVEPGWNLRRLMGWPGQRAPGSGLRDLRLELAYGLIARARPDAGVRVAEIGATIGAPASLPAEQAGADDAPARLYLSAFRRLRALESRRLAVDKLWQDRADGDLTLEAGITFRLRRTFKRKTIDETGAEVTTHHGPITPLRWPVPGGLPGDLHPDIASAFSANEDDETAFPGGVSWAFESAAILRTVYGVPDSDGGRIQNLHLSALGAWGGQRALFDERRQAIETETGMGRVHRCKLERIGRIGALWNRAKHVIIYERTVVPSTQFYHVGPTGAVEREQDELLGRPILRKVEEYVEILQPIRRYPESGNAVSAAGCLIGVDFRTQRIRVDSRWGGDIGREGWQVPLWNTRFAGSQNEPDNPDDPAFVYPKPQIRFLVAGEGGGEIALEIDEPQKLAFYTSTLKGEGDDTDAWRPVRDIDFVDVPLPARPKREPVNADLVDALQPPEPRHVPGYERLTIGLSESKQAAALTHGRQEDGPVALLRNVTLGRALPLEIKPKDDDFTRAIRLGTALAEATVRARGEIDRSAGAAAAQVAAATVELDRASDLGHWKGEAKAAVDRLLEDSFVENLERGVGDAVADLRAIPEFRLGDACEALKGRVRMQVEVQLDRFGRMGEAAIAGAVGAMKEPLQAIESRAQAFLVGTEDVLDRQAGELKEALLAGVDGLAALVDDIERSVQDKRARAQADVRGIADQIAGGIDQAEGDLQGGIGEVREQLELASAVLKDASQPLDSAKAAAEVARGHIEVARNALAKVDAGRAPAVARRILVLAGETLDRGDRALAAVAVAIDADRARLAQAIDEAKGKLSAFLDALRTRIEALATTADGSALREIEGLTNGILDSAGMVVAEGCAALRTALPPLRNAITAIDPTQPRDPLLEKMREVVDRVRSARADLDAAIGDVGAISASILRAAQTAVRAELATKLVPALDATCATFEGFADEIGKTAGKAADWIKENLDVAGYREDLRHELHALIDRVEGDLDDVRKRAGEIRREAERRVAQLAGDVERRAREFAGSIQEGVRDALGADPVELADHGTRMFQQGSDTLRLIRAIGDPPKTDRLGFNRSEVAYLFREANKLVDMTPAVALINRAADTAAAAEAAAEAADKLLQSFGVRLPASSLADQLVPDKLRNLDVSRLLPDFAGLKLDGLFKNLTFPDLPDSDAIKIRHGYDKSELRAWLEADVDIPFGDAATLLEYGPVKIVIDDARFTSTARLSAGRDGSERRMSGRIAGDWRVMAGGQTVLTFRRTGLLFDETGRLDFRIQPDRVELADALKFLTDFMKATKQKGGLQVTPFLRGGMPAGVAASLTMPIPPIQTGAFGISDLSLHVLFGIAAAPDFELFTELFLATKTAPFTLNVWILNGGGFLTSRLSFLPTARPAPLLAFSLEIGILAGVGLGFSFGVVSGGVWLQVGCSVQLLWRTGGGSATTIRVFILARGNVDVAGLITASINLLLEVAYDGANMIGSGTLSIRVRVSMFLTLSVSERVQYVFAGRSEGTDGSYSEAYE
ncbi:hypothetical protein [Methylobacterium planeticum]|uniref:Uncharacterized protein n=1 Tax=Methylobacterium planeticum TaxID=2615211 RepID=A0A6N6MNZ1_9HYPH|nr:hypothetical protein [Methylobacterium planeticum]KAB1070164.1 hypothetical protein F6X51_23640 [Methylobacterium planeticum]